MYLHKWNEALVDWVNCLALTTRIKVIGELQDGNFFRLLLQEFSPPDEGIDNDILTDSFSSVYNLLKKEFPRYGVHEIERENNTKLSYISSLLLLLSVTKGKSPMFRSHLCEDLQHESQVKIKCFLESCLQCADQLDHKYLKSVIEGDFIANEMTIPPTQTRELALAKTPMKMFFDSPRQTDKLTRDLRRLEAENEALQIEKMELEDELRIEKEKREQIEGNLQMKTEQVVKLREELQDFTQNVNDHEKAEEDVTNYHTVHALKSEVRELESYLTSLQEEKALLNEEKVKLQEKFSAFQSKNKELEMRSCYSENKNEELQIMLNKRDQEIHALKEQCVELEEKIRALPLQHNMSIESDTSMHLGSIVSSPFSGGECLSHAVVDVKLAEVEEENEKLKDQIKMTIDQREMLTVQLGEVKDKLEKAKVAQEAATTENIKIQHQLVESSSERDQLRTTLDEVNSKLSKLQELNSVSKKELADLNRRFIVAVELNHQLEDDYASLKKDIYEKQSCLDEMKIKFDFVTSEKQVLIEKENDLKVLTEDLNVKLSEEKVRCFKLTNSLKKVEKSVLNEIAAIITEGVVDETLKIDSNTSSVDKIQNALKMLQVYHSEKLSEKQKLETYVSSLENDVKHLEEAKQDIIKEKADYKNQLLDAGNKISNLEIKMKEHEKKTEQLTGELSERNSIVEKTTQEISDYKKQLVKMKTGEKSFVESISLKEKELGQLKDKLSKEESLIHSLKADQEAVIVEKKQLESYVASLESKVKHLEETKQDLFNEKSNYERQLLDAGEMISNLEIKLKDLEKRTEQLTGELSEKDCLLEKTLLEITDCEVKLATVKKDRDSIVDSISLKDIELQELKGKLDKDERLILSLKSDHEALMIEKKQIEYHVASLESDVRNLEETKQNFFNEKSNYERQLLDAGNKICCLEIKLEELEKKIKELEGELSEKKCLLEKTMLEITDYGVKLAMTIKDKHSIVDSISLKDKKLQELKDKLTDDEIVIHSLRSDRESLIVEKKQLESCVVSLKNDVKHWEETKQDLFKEKSNHESQLLAAGEKISNLETKLAELKKNIEQLAGELSENNCLVQKTLQEKADYEVQLEMMKHDMDSIVENISLKEKELQELKDKLSKEENLIQSLKSDQDALIGEKKRLESYVATLESDVKHFEETKQDFFKEKSNYERQLLDAGDKISNLEIELAELERKILELEEELSEKNYLVQKTMQEIGDYEVKLEVMKRDKDFSGEDIFLKEKELQDLKDKLSKEESLIHSLKSDQEGLIGEKKRLESYVATLESDVKHYEETKQDFFKEKSNCERQLLDAGDKISNLEMELSGLEKKILQLEGELSEKNCLVQNTMQEVADYEVKLEMMKHDKDSVVESISSKEKELQELKDKLSKEESLIHSLKSDQEALIGEKKRLESYVATLESDVKHYEETKQDFFKEKSNYERQLLDAGDKISNLEIELAELERKILQLEEELSEKNCLVQKTMQEIGDYEVKLEVMKRDKDFSGEDISLKEKELQDLKDKLSKEESLIHSLKLDREDLIDEKKQVLSMVDELRTTIDMLQQQLDLFIEERTLIENKLSQWKSHCETLEKKIKDLIAQNSYLNMPPKITEAQEAVETKFDVETCAPLCLEKTVTIKKDEILNICFEKLSPENIGKKDHLNNEILQVSSVSEDKNGCSDSNYESMASGNCTCFKDQGVELGERLKQINVEKELWRLVSSWHELEIMLEKLEAMRHNLSTKISCLWDTMPTTELKTNKLFLAKGSARISGKEPEQSKEVAMRLESMIRSLEKHQSSLERDLMHASSAVVTWGLSGIQDQFGTISNEMVPFNVSQLSKGDGDLSTIQERRKGVYSLLDTLGDKLSQALEDVNSTAEIFHEVQRRCESATDALEYLKRNCLYEEEMLNGISREGTSEALVEKEDGERLKKALEEMEIAKRDLERITKETHKELEIIQREKEDLVQKVELLTTRNSLLENKLEMSENRIERTKQETMEKVQKIFEGKLVKMKEKLKDQYMDDLIKFNEESKMCKQYEESYKKYRSLVTDYEKRLSDTTAQNKDLLNKVQILKKQKSILEDKLRHVKMELGTGDARRDSLASEIYKSHSVENIANYFAKGKIADASQVKFHSERSLVPENISNSISRESVHSNLPSGMGQVFCAEDEEGELFNATYLADLKEGKCVLPSNVPPTKRETMGILSENNKQSNHEASGLTSDYESSDKRVSELMRRNTLCLPHMKSSYPTEMQFYDPKNFSEDFLKGNFSLKVPLLGENQSRRLSGNIYGDSRRRKDIGQTTYMKPGPPTPGKNRRSSLQGAEHGIEQGKIQSTPGRFRSWFGRGKRAVPISDSENIPVTPRTKQKGILRRALANLERDGS